MSKSLSNFSGYDGVEFVEVDQAVLVEVCSLDHFLELPVLDDLAQIVGHSSEVFD